jgi:UPF0042 nucleotide-binding protein
MDKALPVTDRNPIDDQPPAPILLVTGMSGAGKSTALKLLEDLGYEAVDNLPLSLLGQLLAVPGGRRLAIGIDARTRAFSPSLVLDAIGEHATAERAIRILYIDCAGHELVRRFSETRRRHPLALDRPAGDGIAMEREMLAELRRVADVVIDTTDLSSNDLRRAIATRFGVSGHKALTLTLMSFGYARGVPRDADLVFDMRFLKNPHWVPELRPLTGLDPAVSTHVKADPAYAPAFAAIMGLLRLLLPGYAHEGRAYLTVAFGCTGGRHRSVAVAQAAGAELQAAGWPNAIVHRDRTMGPEDDALGGGEESPAAPAPEKGRT